MKHILTNFCLILLIIFGTGGEHTAKEDFPVLKGPYLGQKPPGMIPEIFAPDIITNAPHSVAVFSPDGPEVFWVSWSTLKMKTMRLIDGVWTKPQTVWYVDREPRGDWSEPALANFSLRYFDFEPLFTPDNKIR